MSKRNKARLSKGAVSVFLVMILVPCLLVSSIFVDTGRVSLAKALTNSASDLALDSLLTNYDYDLKEWYGLAASCQTIDEFYEVSADYFLRTISSHGLNDDEIYLVSDYYANAVNDDTIHDLVNAKCISEKNNMISAVENANLSNPSLMKDQVVEFMKYRAPIELTTSLIDRLKKDSSVTEAIESSENEDLVDDKKEYYEAEGDLLEAAFYSYRAIMKYYKKGLKNDTLTAYASKINAYKNVYKEINEKTITNLLNTDGLTVYHRCVFNISDYGYGNTSPKYNEKSNQIYSRKVTEGSDTKYYINSSRIDSLCTGLSNAINDFNQKKTDFENAGSTYATNLPSGSINEIQWWVKCNNAVNKSNGNLSTKIRNAADTMMKKYSLVAAMKKAIDDNKLLLDEDVDTAHWGNNPNHLINNVVTIAKKYLSNPPTLNVGNDIYVKIVSNLETVSANNIYNIMPSNLYVTVDGNNLSFEQAVPKVGQEMSSIRNELNETIDLLDIAIDGRGKTKSLNKLKDLAREYHNKYNNWKGTANTTNTSMAEEDRIEIYGDPNDPSKKGIDDISSKITDSAVTELKTRLVNIRSQLRDMVNAIDAVKFGGTKLRDINDFNTAKNKIKSGIDVNNLPLNNSELVSFANEKFESKFSPNSDQLISVSHLDDYNYNLLIDPDSGSVHTPELFMYFHRKFKDADEHKVDEHNDGKNKAKKAAEDKEKENKNKNRYHYSDTKTISREYSGDKAAGLGNAISAVVKLFKPLLDDNAKLGDVRDDLYVTTYIMKMFSYATFQDEGKFNIIPDNQNLTINGNRVPAEYNQEEWVNKWKNEDPKFYQNKTLTNKMINKSNNAAYCAEVEYILYGKTGEDSNLKNVKTAYGKIYALRYPLNLISGFANFWSAGNNATAGTINGIAAAISGATQGIIPAALVKVVLISLLTAFETGQDLDRLEAGFPVELYKSSDADWWYSIPSGKDSFEDGMDKITCSGKKAGNNGLFYSDYMFLFVYFGLSDNDVAKNMYQRMAEVMQTNMKNQKGVPQSYSLAKSQVYFRLKAQIRVKPIMITLPYFVDYKNNLNTATDWCTFDVETIRGY